MQGTTLPCKCLPRAFLPLRKIHKNVTTLKIKNTTGRVETQQFSDLQTQHKIQFNSFHFGKKLSLVLLTFQKNEGFDLYELEQLI